MNEPTQEQIAYAKRIAETFGISLPKEFTFEAYWLFIQDHEFQFKTRASDEGVYC